jgi:DNA-binding transcriptional ArsR family regulator
MSLPAVHQHLAVLEDAGIVTSHKIGRVRTVQLATDALTGAGRDGPAAAPRRAPAGPARHYLSTEGTPS